jgi:type II secretory pathway pseudopilin PulG
MKPACPIPRRRRRAFTMVEIALCLAIIAFALVAIIGVLPTGMTVQRDNRADTIIAQDGAYWMNAIRGGATGSVDLANFVYEVVEANSGVTNSGFNDSAEVLGLLSTPTAPTNAHRAKVRAISGSAVERDPGVIGFDYYLYAQVLPFRTNLLATNNAAQAILETNLWEVRLVFRWPILPNGDAGGEKKVFRTLVSGTQATQTNAAITATPLHFFPAKTFE